jgi:hypothetical protein
MKLLRWLYVILSVLPISCGDTAETADNGTELEILEFLKSDCGNSAPLRHPLLTDRDNTEYAGLRCIAWEVTNAPSVRLDFINFRELCDIVEVPWIPTAHERDDGTIALTATWEPSFPNACGYCLYDFSFEVSISSVEQALDVAFASRGCSKECSPLWYRGTLPIAEMPSGITCEYIETISLSDQPDARGSLHMPTSNGQCDNGLIAVDDICVGPCSVDTDCPLVEVQTCQQNACVLTDAFFRYDFSPNNL